MGFKPLMVLVLFASGLISILSANIIVSSEGRVEHISGQLFVGIILILLSIYEAVMLFV